MKRRLAIVCGGSLAVLAGCAAGNHFQRPAVALPAQWGAAETAAGAAEPVAAWWTTFHDAEFSRLAQRAMQANLDLKRAAARVAAARAERRLAGAELQPSVNAAAAASRNRQEVIAPEGRGAKLAPVEFNNFEAGFDASWELDVFGRLRRNREAAAADLAASREERRGVMVAVLGDVGRAYMELRGFQLRREIAEKNIRAQQDTLELTRARQKAGLATELDVARAAAQLETTRSEVPGLEGGIEGSIHRLSVLVGEEPDALRLELVEAAPVPFTPPEVPAGLPSELLERRPDVRQAEARIRAATARVEEAHAEFFPRFRLIGTAGRQAAQLHDITLGMGNLFGVGPAISLPIFTGGRIRARIQAQDAGLREAAVAYRAAVLAALEETENALVNYAQEQRRRERLEAAVRSNGEAVRLATDAYRAGVTDFLSVLDAERELYSHEDLLAQSRTAQAVDLIALYKALGGGWQLFPQ